MSKRYQFFLITFMSALSAFGPFVIDLYLPAFPNIAEFFHTSPAMVQFTLTGTMIGIACGQLIVGPLSDKLGRRLPLAITLSIFTLTTVAIIFSPSIEIMIVLRFLQGFAAAGSLVISRATIADLYHGEALTRSYGMMMTISGFAPIISPSIGSLLLKMTDWHGVFITLVVIGIIMFAGLGLLRESHAPENRLQGSVWRSFGAFFPILKNRHFLLFTILLTCNFSALFAYVSVSPFILQEYYHLSTTLYGICFGVNGCGIVLGSNLGSRLGSRRALDTGVLLLLIATIYLVIMLLQHAPVWWVEAGFFALLFACGIIFPAASASAIETAGRNTGSASAIIGFAQFFMGGVISPLVSVGNIFIATSGVITFFVAMVILCYGLVRNLL